MKFETIVLLLWFMIVFVQSGFGHRDVIQSCNQKNEILLRENTWLAIKNKNLSWKLKCLSEKGL